MQLIMDHAVKAWINPNSVAGLIGDSSSPLQCPIDTQGLFDLFERYNSNEFYTGTSYNFAGSTRCCASGTCDIYW